MIDALIKIWESSGLANMDIRSGIMLIVACFLIYLAIGKKFEPLLLLPIAFGMLLANLPLSGLMHSEYFASPTGDLDIAEIMSHGGLLDILYLGVKCGIYPPLIFLGIGAMTDFSPLISRKPDWNLKPRTTPTGRTRDLTATSEDTTCLP